LVDGAAAIFAVFGEGTCQLKVFHGNTANILSKSVTNCLSVSTSALMRGFHLTFAAGEVLKNLLSFKASLMIGFQYLAAAGIFVSSARTSITESSTKADLLSMNVSRVEQIRKFQELYPDRDFIVGATI
jgi:hypothetical protein